MTVCGVVPHSCTRHIIAFRVFSVGNITLSLTHLCQHHRVAVHPHSEDMILFWPMQLQDPIVIDNARISDEQQAAYT